MMLRFDKNESKLSKNESLMHDEHFLKKQGQTFMLEYEPVHEKTNKLHGQKQSRRSASR